MVPTSFSESNLVLSRPPDMTAEQCEPLSVFADGKQVISCWKLTADELKEFQRTGRIWLVVFGETMPAVALTVSKSKPVRLGAKPAGGGKPCPE